MCECTPCHSALSGFPSHVRMWIMRHDPEFNSEQVGVNYDGLFCHWWPWLVSHIVLPSSLSSVILNTRNCVNPNKSHLLSNSPDFHLKCLKHCRYWVCIWSTLQFSSIYSVYVPELLQIKSIRFEGKFHLWLCCYRRGRKYSVGSVSIQYWNWNNYTPHYLILKPT